MKMAIEEALRRIADKAALLQYTARCAAHAQDLAPDSHAVVGLWDATEEMEHLARGVSSGGLDADTLDRDFEILSDEEPTEEPGGRSVHPAAIESRRSAAASPSAASRVACGRE
jgi:hypothetical protein